MADDIVVLTSEIGNYHDFRYRSLVNNGLNIHVLSFKNEGFFPEFLGRPGGSYHSTQIFDDYEHYVAGAKSGRLEECLAAELNRIDPSVVAIAGWAAAESACAIDWAKRKSRALLLMSDSQKYDAPRNFLREGIKRSLVSLCDAGFVAGRTHRDYLVELGMKPQNIFTGYDVVDNRHFSEGAARAKASEKSLRHELGLPDRYWMACGRLIEKKNFKALISGYANLRKVEPAIPNLVIIGDGPQRQEIEDLISFEGIRGEVALLGFKDYQDMPSYYGLAEAFIHVPIVEQWGLVLNEAAASGLPIISSKACGAARELLRDGRNGFLINSTDVTGIQAALLRLALLSESQVREQGELSAEFSNDWDVNHYIRGFNSGVRVALRRGGRSPNVIDHAIINHLKKKVVETVQ